MPQHQETRFLPYRVPQMFALVADIERYPEFLPWCKEARLVSTEKDVIIADLLIGYKLFQEKFTSEVILDRPRNITVHHRAGPLSHLTNIWQFDPRGRKGCDVTFYVDFDFQSPLLRAAMNVFFDVAITKMVSAFEDRARALYG